MNPCPEVRQYPPGSAPQSFCHCISAHRHFREFIKGREGELGSPKRACLHESPRFPLTLTAAAPSSSALPSLRAILTMHSNHTNRGSCLAWTTFHTLARPSAQHELRTTQGGLRCYSWDWYRFQRKQVRGTVRYRLCMRCTNCATSTSQSRCFKCL